MKTKDHMALMGLMPTINPPQSKVQNPMQGTFTSPNPTLQTSYSHPGHWSNTPTSALNYASKIQPWECQIMPDSSSPGSSPGSYSLSPMMQSSSPATPQLGSPIFENYSQPMMKSSSSLVNGRTESPQRPKSYEQRLAGFNVARKCANPMTQQQIQDSVKANLEEQNGSRPKSESEKDKVWKQKPERYKTELCRAFEDHNWCKYGSRCQFAHGQPELRSVDKHPKYKTQLCNAYHSTGYCKYGTRCHFVHNVDESRVANPVIANPNSEMSRRNSGEENSIACVPQIPVSKPSPNAQRMVVHEISLDTTSQDYMDLKMSSKNGSGGMTPVLPIGTPVKSDLSPYDITKEHFIGSSFLSKQTLAAIWLPENNQNMAAVQNGLTMQANNNNNIVFNFLPKNLLEL